MNYSPFIYAFDQREHRDHRRRHARRPGGQRALVAVEGKRRLRVDEGRAELQRGAPASARHGGARRARRAARVRRGRLHPAELHPAVSLYERAHRGRDDRRTRRCGRFIPVLCQNVTVRGVTINSHGPNNDGCDPESCRDVLIERCVFDTGDDCIAIKSGRNADGRRVNVPSENIIVRNCEMRDGHGGVTIGSEISGGCWNVFAHDCRMDSPQLDRALRLKNNAMRGGVLERHLHARRHRRPGRRFGAVDRLLLRGRRQGPFTPVARDIEMRRVTSRKSPYGAVSARLPQRADRERSRHRLPVRQRREGQRHRARARSGRSSGTTINGVGGEMIDASRRARRRAARARASRRIVAAQRRRQRSRGRFASPSR